MRTASPTTRGSSRPARRTALAIAAAAALGPLAALPASAASCTWNTSSGNWNAIVNWTACATGNGNPAGAPGTADSATIGAAGIVAVTNAQSINALSNAGAVDIASGGGLLLNAGGGGTVNAGAINVAGGGVLYLDGRSFTHAISGGGSIVLGGSTARLYMEGANSTTLAAGSSIRGAGQMGQGIVQSGAMNFINNGTVSADAAAQTLSLLTPANSGVYTNNNVFEARNGGTLQLSANVDQGGSGVLQALSGSTVQLNGVRVSGGTVSTAGTGTLTTTNNSANLLSNVTLAGAADLTATSQLRIANNLQFSGGSILVGPTSNVYFDNRASNGLSTTQAVSGTGSITLAGGALRVEGTGQTTLGSGVTIAGWGSFGQAIIESGGHTFINNGTVSANSSGNVLALQAMANGAIPVQNNNILEATGGGTLRLDTSVVGAAGSQLRAGADSTIVINGVTLSGAISTTGSGTVTASNTSANLLDNVSLSGVIDLTPTAQLRIANNLAMTAGSSILVGPSSNLYFDSRASNGLSTTQAVSGSGSIALAGGGLRVEGAGQTTIGSGVTIAGWGSFGQAIIESGGHTFINNGTVSANFSGNVLALQAMANGAIPVQNNNILEATGGGTLRLDTSVVGAAGSQLRAGAGSTIVINGVTLSGAISTTGSGTVTASNTSANLLDNVSLSGVIDLTPTAQLRIANNLAMTAGSSILVGPSSNLYFDSRASNGLSTTQAVSGSGSIALAGGGLRVEGAGQTTIGSGVTIAGWGSFGQALIESGAHTFINNGTISANSAGNTLTLQPFANNGALSGSGTLRVAGGTLSVATGQDSTQGVLDIGASGSLASNNQNLTLTSDYTSAQWGSGNSFNRRAGITGTGQILAGGNAAMNVTGTGVTGGATGNATLTIGNVRVGGTTFNYQLANVGTTGPTLRGAIQTSVNGGNLTDSRLVGAGVTPSIYSAGAPGSNGGNLGVTFTAATAGLLAPLSGQVLNLRSNFENIADQRLNIALASGAAAFNAAVGVATPSPVALAAQRVGGTLSTTLTVANAAAAGSFSEDLNASFSGFTGGGSGSGSISGRLAGTNNTGSGSMSVGLDTSTSGAKSGTAVLAYSTAGAVNGVGNGLGVTPVGTQTINVTGNVYAPAVAQLGTPTVNFGTVRVGTSVTPATVSVSNTASGALTDTLRASLAGGASPFNTAGTASGIVAGGSNSSGLTVGLNTSAAGVFSSSGVVTLTSQNPEMADLALGTANVNLLATVNNLAAASLAKTGGAGSFGGGGTSYTLNFGTLLLGGGTATSALSLANIASGPADALAGSFILSALAGTPFSAISGFSAFTGVAPGGSLAGGLSVGFNTSTVGSFSGSITLTPRSTNASQADLTLGAITLNLQGSVVAVPEPGTWALWWAGLAVLGGLARRQSARRG